MRGRGAWRLPAYSYGSPPPTNPSGTRSWHPWLLASTAATGLLLAAYAADVTGTAVAGLQRAAVTVPQAAVAAIAACLIGRGGLA
jgi:hypothetical protein